MNKIKTFALLCVPYVFLAILSNKRPQDRRPIKYFFPYEKVRRNALAVYGEAEAKRAFGPQIVNPPKEGIAGFFHSWMPFGLVLWLDKGAKFPSGSNPAPGANSPQTIVNTVTKVVSDPGVANLNKKIDAFRQEISLRQDRLEVLLLRALRQKQ